MINRRRFLRGLFGVTVALPFLESLAPRNAAAGPGDVPPFAIFMRQANGVAQQTNDEPEMFWPRNLGAITAETMNTDSDRAISELRDYADKLLVVRGVKFAFPGNGCGHSGGGNQCLTAARVSDTPSGNASLSMGESIDNRIARELNAAGVEPLTLYAGKMAGYIDEVMSYRGPKDIRAAERNPYNAYMALFGLSDLEPEVLKRLAAQRTSVNDLVREQMKALQSRGNLSEADKQKLDLHFTSIRDLEVTMSCQLPDEGVAAMEAISGSAGANDNVEIVARMQMDIIALAMACGVTRAATLQIGDGNDSTSYLIDGVRQKSFHKISHRIDSDGSDGPPIEGAATLHHKIDRIHGQLFKYLLDRLSAYEFGEGKLLDYGVAVWLNDLADKYHSYNNVPYILAGGAAGFLKTGQYVNGGNSANNKLLNTIGAAVGCRNADGQLLDDFGDPSLERGLLDDLIA
ncbi:DUF1552 domain-containing protein [Chondromyces apiculatus]|uniref:Tat (Twin-arginine translocation) pathway signal sequence domain protein n=1 Tax=Chondromyces apiculatus DSM 436 TaxID=1192034 RepID=A0A017T795_9BACT|nr:DUF1552 domain-containing protein [Chondromyces apiculatus]EYF05118.1 Hypothetical protein CAP_3481 [Chondromyces apiculatus DSM 436]